MKKKQIFKTISIMYLMFLWLNSLAMNRNWNESKFVFFLRLRIWTRVEKLEEILVACWFGINFVLMFHLIFIGWTHKQTQLGTAINLFLDLKGRNGIRIEMYITDRSRFYWFFSSSKFSEILKTRITTTFSFNIIQHIMRHHHELLFI